MLDELLHPVLAMLDPQAGGGGSFGGGGGGGGGSGGGDLDGIFWLVYWLLRLAIEVPVVGVPLLVVVIGALVVGSRKGWWKHQERTIRRARPQRRALAEQRSVGVLRAADPGFAPGRFLARVSTAFAKAQSSWCAQDLEPLRAFVTDGVFERFSLQIEEQVEDGWRQEMRDLQVGPIEIVHVSAGAHFDTLTVSIAFRAEILRVSRETGRELPGTALPRNSFTECWSFVRRRGVKTTRGDGLMEGMCPNCGAALAMSQSARCGHCECLVRSGQFDWVLAEITQASEWRAESEAGIPGLAALAARDPGFNVQMLEDHASVAFWRRCAADRSGSAAPLTRLATEELCARVQAAFEAASQGLRTYTGDCAVGSVRTLGFLLGADRDRALVEVVWDGRRATVGAASVRQLDRERRLRRTLFVLERAPGATTRLDEAFTTATCRTCGAHDLGGTDPACPYCGAPRTGDRSTWLLAEIHESGSQEAAGLREQLRSAEPAPARKRDRAEVEQSASGLLLWTAALARSDRDVHERERATLHRLAARLQLPPERVDEFLDDRNDGTGPAPRDPAEARAWYAALVELALADGSISRAERGFLRHAADRLGMSHRESERALAEARSRLYRDSREARHLAR